MPPLDVVRRRLRRRLDRASEDTETLGHLVSLQLGDGVLSDLPLEDLSGCDARERGGRDVEVPGNLELRQTADQERMQLALVIAAAGLSDQAQEVGRYRLRGRSEDTEVFRL